MVSVCFTGHRKIDGDYYNHNHPTLAWHFLKQYLTRVIYGVSVKYNVDTYISGLAIGVDQLAIECVREAAPHVKSEIGNDLKIIGAKPFPSQANAWPASTRARYEHLCGMCDQIIDVSPDPYSPAKMQTRNEWMVDRSNYVIAAWNGVKKGGTWNCIAYAQTQGKSVFAITPDTELSYPGWKGAWC